MIQLSSFMIHAVQELFIQFFSDPVLNFHFQIAFNLNSHLRYDIRNLKVLLSQFVEQCHDKDIIDNRLLLIVVTLVNTK